MLQLSARVEQLHASPIREILSLVSRPGMISFAGGLPAPESFPGLRNLPLPDDALQYGPSEGEPALREWIAARMRALGRDCEARQVLVLSGSQQGIDLVAKLMIDPGTPVAVERPTYLAALQVFRFFGARFVAVDRKRPQLLHEGTERPRLCYVIPTFQNPGAWCYSLEERRALARATERAGALLFEDDPYRDLVYEPCERQPLCSFVDRGSWVYQGSFSKSHAPGLRLGFLVCSPDLITPLTRLKQAADLHSSRVAQHWILQLVQDPGHEERLARLQAFYRQKRDVFAEVLEASLGDLAQWDLPAGGLFFWLKLAEPVDTQTLLQQAISKGVAFMPGEPFFHDQTPADGSYLRLNFSHASAAQVQTGLRILAGLLRQTRTAPRLQASAG
jgi:2-aminoadipate transaminase